MTHVRTSPYYPQPNGKLERWQQALKVTTIRPKAPSSVEVARALITTFVTYYNQERLTARSGASRRPTSYGSHGGDLDDLRSEARNGASAVAEHRASMLTVLSRPSAACFPKVRACPNAMRRTCVSARCMPSTVSRERARLLPRRDGRASARSAIPRAFPELPRLVAPGIHGVHCLQSIWERTLACETARAAALNAVRLDAWLAERPLAPTRVSASLGSPPPKHRR